MKSKKLSREEMKKIAGGTNKTIWTCTLISDGKQYSFCSSTSPDNPGNMCSGLTACTNTGVLCSGPFLCP